MEDIGLKVISLDVKFTKRLKRLNSGCHLDRSRIAEEIYFSACLCGSRVNCTKKINPKGSNIDLHGRGT